MNEHARIATYLAPLTRGEAGAFDLQNDAAALNVPADKQLIITTDHVIAGTHVPSDASAEQLARKLFRRNISDIAAMGGAPWRYSLNLHLPAEMGDDWWQSFTATLAHEQAHYGMVLVGGDCSAGADAPQLSATFYGLCTQPLLRSNARVGDHVYVTGTIGDAALFLRTKTPALAAAYYAPEPPIAFAQTLPHIATACLDISDGLMADAQHIAQASGVQLALQKASLPLSAAVQKHLQAQPDDWPVLLQGDDYQLLFTAAPEHAQTLTAQARNCGTRLTHIGEVRAGTNACLINEMGDALNIAESGYRHA